MIFLYVGGAVVPSVWQPVGNSFIFTHTDALVQSMAKLSDTSFAIGYRSSTSGSDRLVQAFDWDGADFSSISAVLNMGTGPFGSTEFSIDGLGNNDIAVLLVGDDEVRKYTLAAGVWSLDNTGDILEGFVGDICSNAENVVTILDRTSDDQRLDRYQFVGSGLTKIGAQTVLPDTIATRGFIAGIGGNSVVVTHNQDDSPDFTVVTRKYDFGGLTYAQDGNLFDLETYTGGDANPGNNGQSSPIDTENILTGINSIKTSRIQFGSPDFTPVGDILDVTSLSPAPPGTVGFSCFQALTPNRAVFATSFSGASNDIWVQMYELVPGVSGSGSPVPVPAFPDPGGPWETTGLLADPANPQGNTTSLTSFDFADSGSRLYTTSRAGGGIGDNDIYKYDLSSAWDIAAPSLLQVSSIDRGGSLAIANHVMEDESAIYISYSTTTGDPIIRRYDIVTPGDLTTKVNDGEIDLSTITGIDNDVFSIWVNDAETILHAYFVLTDEIHEFSFGTPGDLSTLSATGDVFDFAPYSAGGLTFTWGDGGNKLYFTDNQELTYEFSVNSAYDLTTVVGPPIIQIPGLPNGIYHIHWKDDGERFFIMQYLSSSSTGPFDLFRQYDTP